MPHTFTTRHRYHFVRAHEQLTSFIIIAVLIGAGVLAVGSSVLVILGIADIQGVGLAMLTTSIAGGALLLYTFGATYFPYEVSTKSVEEIMQSADGNAAQAATFELLAAVGPVARGATPDNVNIACQHLLESHFIDVVLERLRLDRSKLQEAIQQYVLPVLTWEEWVRDMLKTAHSFKQRNLTPEHALGALLLHPGLQTWLRLRALTEDDVRFTVWWGSAHREMIEWQKRWWAGERMLAFTGIGLSWASGYTPFVDQFARLPKPNLWDEVIIGHEEKVEQLIDTLARQRQSNVLLVGQPGVGRIGIIRYIARLVDTGQAHPNLNGLRVLYMHIGELLALGTTSASQLGVVSRALREMERAGNVITIIDGLGSILGEAGEQRVNLTDVLLPFLSSLTVRVIVITSPEEYHLRIEPNSELVHYFEIVQILPLSPETTLERLALAVPKFEQQTKLFIPYQTLRAIVENTVSIMPHIPFPERAFDILEEAAVIAQKEGAKTLAEDYINTLISRKIGINIGALKGDERQKLLNLEQIMHERLINQNAAVAALAKAMIRARLAIRTTRRPIGTFLFLGPTGVGKTETAKTLAEVYFGAEEHMVRLDMSEFQGSQGIVRLIGGPMQPSGILTAAIADHPFTVLLLDEFEKASTQVHQLFLQVFDEGHITDFRGNLFSFQHSIIIATSNAGAELVREEAQDGIIPAGFDAKLKEHILRNGIFRPELINRFDGVIVYTTLSEEHIRQIAQLMLRKLNNRLDAKHGITVAVTDSLIDFLVVVGFDPEFGARPMARAIQDAVEYTVAQKILRGEVHAGQQIVLSPQELQATKPL